MNIIVHTYSSPCGELTLGSYGDRLCLCDWTAGKPGDAVRSRLCRLLHAAVEPGMTDTIARASDQLNEYFARERTAFDIPLLFAGSDFQMKVWQGLMSIPYGTTVSYGRLAAMLGTPTSVRAVANANGANAISIFAPCHRVIGSDGSLTGYGGGLETKRYLLRLESNTLF